MAMTEMLNFDGNEKIQIFHCDLLIYASIFFSSFRLLFLVQRRAQSRLVTKLLETMGICFTVFERSILQNRCIIVISAVIGECFVEFVNCIQRSAIAERATVSVSGPKFQ